MYNLKKLLIFKIYTAPVGKEQLDAASNTVLD